MELEKEKNETQLIEERRKKRQEMLANLQQNQELAPNADELSEELVMRKPSASKADVEKYNYIKMVDAMREKNMGICIFFYDIFSLLVLSFFLLLLIFFCTYFAFW